MILATVAIPRGGLSTVMQLRGLASGETAFVPRPQFHHFKLHQPTTSCAQHTALADPIPWNIDIASPMQCNLIPW